MTYLDNEITTASTDLLHCLFESNWIDQTESSKKSVVIVSEMLKKPLQLVILIYPLNLDTFTSVRDVLNFSETFSLILFNFVTDNARWLLNVQHFEKHEHLKGMDFSS